MNPGEIADRITRLENKTGHAKAILDILLIALSAEDPPTGELVQDAVFAATAMLEA